MTTENTSLAIKPNAILGVNMRDLRDVADLIFQSKVFGDIQNKEAAAIKIAAGMERGFTPFQSMSMFDFIQGRPTLNAHGKATLINSSGDFRLKINELTNTNCSISVVRKSDSGEWKTINTETFSWADAVQAGYTTGKNAHSYKQTPRNMLFARCVSNIWRWDTAELNMRQLVPGQINEFEAEELDETAATNGNIVEGEIVEEEKPDFVEPDILDAPDDVDVTDFVEADETEPEHYAGPVDDEDQIEATPLEKLRANVQAAFEELPKSRQRDVIAGKTPISKATEDELRALLAAIQN